MAAFGRELAGPLAKVLGSRADALATALGEGGIRAIQREAIAAARAIAADTHAPAGTTAAAYRRLFRDLVDRVEVALPTTGTSSESARSASSNGRRAQRSSSVNAARQSKSRSAKTLPR